MPKLDGAPRPKVRRVLTDFVPITPRKKTRATDFEPVAAQPQPQPELPAIEKPKPKRRAPGLNGSRRLDWADIDDRPPDEEQFARAGRQIRDHAHTESPKPKRRSRRTIDIDAVESDAAAREEPARREVERPVASPKSKKAEAPKKAEREWSAYQRAVFADFEDNVGHTVVIAVAGSGKTTCIVEGVRRVPRDAETFVCAFGKKIQIELAGRLPSRVHCKTANAMGQAIVQRAFGSEMDEKKTRKIADAVLVDAGFTFQSDDGKTLAKGGAALTKLCKWAKDHLADPGDIALLQRMAIDCDAADQTRGLTAEKLAPLACETLMRCFDDTKTIDFDDQLWFPAMHKLRPSNYDVVVVDECQDFSPAQLALAQSLCRRGGRIVAVGDPAQSIYQFRGADSEAIPRMIRELEARTLPLSVSYRCPEKVAELAREIVPDFQSAPGAPPGIVECDVDPADLYSRAQPGSMVLSRKKAQLVRTALRLVARGTPAYVAGRDIAKTFESFLDASRAQSVPDLLAYARRYRAEKVARMREIDRDDKADEAEDLATAVLELAGDAKSVADVRHRVQQLFADTDNDLTRVVCCTVHAAKGLERDDVWMLGETFRVVPGQGRNREERNLYYVAVTRSKHALHIVGEIERRQQPSRFGSEGAHENARQ